MRLKGTLHDYLMGIDKDAEDMFNLIVKQTAEIEGVAEQLKAADQMERIRRMNSTAGRCGHRPLRFQIFGFFDTLQRGGQFVRPFSLFGDMPYALFRRKRMRIAATCARVAVSPGRSSPSLPLIRPSATAQLSASTA